MPPVPRPSLAQALAGARGAALDKARERVLRLAVQSIEVELNEANKKSENARASAGHGGAEKTPFATRQDAEIAVAVDNLLNALPGREALVAVYELNGQFFKTTQIVKDLSQGSIIQAYGKRIALALTPTLPTSDTSERVNQIDALVAIRVAALEAQAEAVRLADLARKRTDVDPVQQAAKQAAGRLRAKAISDMSREQRAAFLALSDVEQAAFLKG